MLNQNAIHFLVEELTVQFLFARWVLLRISENLVEIAAFSHRLKGADATVQADGSIVVSQLEGSLHYELLDSLGQAIFVDIGKLLADQPNKSESNFLVFQINAKKGIFVFKASDIVQKTAIRNYVEQPEINVGHQKVQLL